MTNSWMNEDGEPIMDGAAWRFEQQLDMDSAADRAYDDFYDRYDECDEDHQCEDCGNCVDACTCEDRDADPDEDSWLDGSYEE